jgi:hypothetical protein
MFCLLLLLIPSAGTRAAEPFKVGAAAVDVTPTRFPISMNGQMHDQVATSAFSRLHARCVVLDDGATEIAIVVVDSCMIPRPLFDDAKTRASRSTGIKTEHMMMSATHTHTAPAALGVFQTEPDSEYVTFLTAKIAEAVEQAHKNRVPAKVGWAVGQDPTQVFCRRWKMKPGTAQTNPFGGTTGDQAQMHPGYLNPNAVEPTGPVDPSVSVLAAQTLDGRPIALLANYGMHYAGYGIPGGTVSADYFGRFCDKIKARMDADANDSSFVAILSNGPCAATHCYDYSKAKVDVTIETVSDSVAKVAFETYKSIEYHDSVPLKMAERRLTIPLRLAGADEVAKAHESLQNAKGPSLTTLGDIYARETVLLDVGLRETELKLQALRVGSLGIAAIPNEVYAETGLAIKRESPLSPMFVIELANGASGYIPPPEQHALGGYTTWRARSSCLEIGAEPKIREAIVELLHEVAR